MPEYYMPNESANSAVLSEGKVFWNPPTNVTIPLRIGPPWSKAGLIWKMRANHYGLEEGNDEAVRAVCADVHFGVGQCEICKFANRVEGQGKAGKSLSKNIRANFKYYTNVLIRGQEALGWRVWGATKGTATALTDLAQELKVEGKAHFAHPKDGRDILLTVKGEGIGKRYAVRPVNDVSPIGVDIPLIDLDELISIDMPNQAYIKEVIRMQFAKDFPDAI
jgi:hypothetical protein